MSFADVLFPRDISYGSQGGPEFNTSVVTNGGGYEQRNRNRRVPTWKFNVIYGIKTLSQYQDLYNFFLAVGAGKWQSFRYEDPVDHSFEGHVIGTGDGSTTTFQLVKHYTSGGQTLYRPITKPVAGSVSLFLNGVLQVSGFTVNALTGIVTFDAAPGDGVVVAATAAFHVPARFDIDYLPAIADAQHADELVLHIENIPLMEDRRA